jgi:hypothetical protein
MADDTNDIFARAAKRFGIPLARVSDMRALAQPTPAAAPEPQRPSYEGVTLESLAPKPLPMIGPPAPPPPPRQSYEGVSLGQLAPPPTPGVSLAEPARPAVGMPAPAKPTMRMQTGDNISTSPPAAVKPAVMKQFETVAKNSEAATKQVKTSLDENERAKNLEGATFVDSGQQGGAVTNPYGGAPILVDKGGRRAASWQVQQGLDLGQDARDAVEDADASNRKAAGLDYAAGQQAAEYERGYLDRLNQASEKHAVEESARAQKYQGQVDATMGRLADLRAQIRSFKVDPYGGMNPGVARLGQTIAIALGAFASKRGENQGLEAVKHTIAMNVADDEKKLDRLERGARGEETFLGQLRQQYGDKKLASEAAHIAYLERAKVELAKNLGSPEVADPRLLAAYNRLNAKIDDELFDRTARFKGITEDRVIRHDVNAQPRYVGAGADHRDETDAKWIAEQREKAGIPTSLADLQGVDQVIDTLGSGDIEGIGPVVSSLPDWMYARVGTERGIANRQKIAAVKNRVRKSIAGASLTEGEKVELNKELDAAGDASSLRRSVQSLRQRLHNQDQNIRAGARPGGNYLYEARGGQKRIPLDKPTTPYIKPAQ